MVPLVKVNESALELASSLLISLLENVDVIDNPKRSAIDSVKDIANALLIDVVEHPGNAKAGLVGCASESVGSVGRHCRFEVNTTKVEKRVSIFSQDLERPISLQIKIPRVCLSVCPRV